MTSTGTSAGTPAFPPAAASAAAALASQMERTSERIVAHLSTLEHRLSALEEREQALKAAGSASAAAAAALGAEAAARMEAQAALEDEKLACEVRLRQVVSAREFEARTAQAVLQATEEAHQAFAAASAPVSPTHAEGPGVRDASWVRRGSLQSQSHSLVSAGTGAAASVSEMRQLGTGTGTSPSRPTGSKRADIAEILRGGFRSASRRSSIDSAVSAAQLAAGGMDAASARLQRRRAAPMLDGLSAAASAARGIAGLPASSDAAWAQAADAYSRSTQEEPRSGRRHSDASAAAQSYLSGSSDRHASGPASSAVAAGVLAGRRSSAASLATPGEAMAASAAMQAAHLEQRSRSSSSGSVGSAGAVQRGRGRMGAGGAAGRFDEPPREAALPPRHSSSAAAVASRQGLRRHGEAGARGADAYGEPAGWVASAASSRRPSQYGSPVDAAPANMYSLGARGAGSTYAFSGDGGAGSGMHSASGHMTQDAGYESDSTADDGYAAALHRALLRQAGVGQSGAAVPAAHAARPAVTGSLRGTSAAAPQLPSSVDAMYSAGAGWRAAPVAVPAARKPFAGVNAGSEPGSISLLGSDTDAFMRAMQSRAAETDALLARVRAGAAL
jgi:hypothetical protein